jgi:hypothetical protein
MNRLLDPPWLAFPEYGPEDPFWRQAGEAYLSAFLSEWAGMSDAEKTQYLLERDPPAEWLEQLRPGGFLDWLRDAVD